MTQQQLANRCDTSIATVSRIERGVQPYSQELLEAFAAALQCEPTDILNRDPKTPAHEIWRVIQGMSDERQKQAVRLVRALAEEDDAA